MFLEALFLIAFQPGPHDHGMSPATEATVPSMESSMHDMNTGEMAPATVLGLPLTRLASGTSWQPDTTPHAGRHYMAGPWMLMAHGNVFGGLNVQASPRGGRQFTAVSWFMGMAQREAAGGTIEPRLMLSFDPLTVGKRGYPLLFQSGESAGGVPLHDRQHPHDLFMEAALSFRRELTSGVAGEIYAALPGEPALGPTAFPHRASAMPDPLAPIGHHWQDATHISYGVLTAGLFTRAMKLEGSWFNGREPDEYRYDIELRQLDAYAGRFSWNPGPNWSLQSSYGYLPSPEVLTPGESLHRITASATFNAPTSRGAWASTGVWGRNIDRTGKGTNSYLFEGAWNIDGENEPFLRVEYTQKFGHDLALPPAAAEGIFQVGELSAGFLRHFGAQMGLEPGLGIRGAVYAVGEPLRAAYGARSPVGGILFVNLRPAAR